MIEMTDYQPTMQNHKRFNGNGNRGGRFDNGNDMMPNSNGGSGRGNNSMRRRGGGAPQYRSMRNTKSNDNGDSKSPKEIEKSPMSNRWRSGGASTKSKGTNHNKKSTVIAPEKYSALMAGDHVEITTKHNQIINGIVYCSIPQVPPLCIIR